jgi:hypothetical protein
MLTFGLSAAVVVLAMAAIMYVMRVRASRAFPGSRVEETPPEQDAELDVTRMGVARFDLDAALARRSDQDALPVGGGSRRAED